MGARLPLLRCRSMTTRMTAGLPLTARCVLMLVVVYDRFFFVLGATTLLMVAHLK